jgi:hypothetical protein
MIVRTRAIAFVSLASFVSLSSCGGSPPTSPGSGETITGSERFGWDQPAADAGELATFRYALYVNDARSEALDVSCDAAAAGGTFPCTSRLPALATGTHTLQVAAFVLDGGVIRESARSAGVRVTKR